MEVNLPGLVDAAFPNRGNHSHVRVLSHNDGGSGSGSSSSGAGTIRLGSVNRNDPAFLSDAFPRGQPKLYVTAESDDFDALTLREWRDEGFDVEYLAMGPGYEAKLGSLGRAANLGPCETYGIVAFGDAAAACLEYFHVLEHDREQKLGCLVAYYPTRIPDPQGKFPSSVRVLAHLARVGGPLDVVSRPQLGGLQGRRRVHSRKVERGLGPGGSNRLAYPAYSYDAEPGFAEHDLDEYEKISAELAWSRSLATVRRAFNKNVDCEAVLEQNEESKFYTRQLGPILSTYTTHKPAHVTYFPTLTGAIGADELRRFYADFFLASNPPSLKLTLVSRTVGADRVVDELHVAFKHTQPMPWILPGVPPTHKRVEVMLVSIVALRGGKLYHEHVYWDQASVLVQTGLLDPKLLPQKARDRGARRMPVVGREAARRVLKGFDDEDGEADNELIPEWYSDEEEEEEEDDDEVDGDGDGKNGGSKAEKEKPAPQQKPKTEETQPPPKQKQEKVSQKPGGDSKKAEEQSQGPESAEQPPTQDKEKASTEEAAEPEKSTEQEQQKSGTEKEGESEEQGQAEEPEDHDFKGETDEERKDDAGDESKEDEHAPSNDKPTANQAQVEEGEEEGEKQG
ncbi:hypothetical protein F4780DRAFT_713656 [Xylariomycetidae sp. FL0641]|nr:hypothetical protein F4780DRAFT_713656 [Xylariomycetidae sp. FL0641]